MLLDPQRVITVIIPTCNDALHLPGTINALRTAASQSGQRLNLRIVDAGSSDGTPQIAEAYEGIVHHAPLLRLGPQLNYGSAGVRTGILWFVRVGTAVPADAYERISEVMADPRILGGGFARFYDSPSRLLRYTCRLTAWRTRRYGWIRGDQSLFVRAEVFHAMGGFSESARGKTLDFARRLRRQGKTVLINSPVVSSAQRYQRRGPVRQTLRDFRFTLKTLRQ